MQKRIMVCLFALAAVFLRGDGDAFVNNYQTQPAAGKSELNYSRDVYQGAFQDGLKNISPDYQEAPASSYLDPNATSDPVLNDGQIAGIAMGGAAALAGLGAGNTLIAKKWSKSINAKIKKQQAPGGAQAFSASPSPAATYDPYAVVQGVDGTDITAGELKRRNAESAAALTSSATLRFGTSKRVSVADAGLPWSVDAHSALQTDSSMVPPLPSSAVPGHGRVPPVRVELVDEKTSRRSLRPLALGVKGARALSGKSRSVRSIRSASSKSLRLDSKRG